MTAQQLGAAPATPGAVVNVPAVPGGQFMVIFPVAATLYVLTRAVNVNPSDGVASFAVSGNVMTVTMDGTIGTSIVGWVDGAGVQQAMTLQSQAPAQALCGPGMVPNPAWLTAVTDPYGNPASVPTCIPAAGVAKASAPASSAAKVAMVAAGVAVVGVGVAVAASRGAFTAVAHEAAEAIRRSRV